MSTNIWPYLAIIHMQFVCNLYKEGLCIWIYFLNSIFVFNWISVMAAWLHDSHFSNKKTFPYYYIFLWFEKVNSTFKIQDFISYVHCLQYNLQWLDLHFTASFIPYLTVYVTNKILKSWSLWKCLLICREWVTQPRGHVWDQAKLDESVINKKPFNNNTIKQYIYCVSCIFHVKAVVEVLVSTALVARQCMVLGLCSRISKLYMAFGGNWVVMTGQGGKWTGILQDHTGE